MSKKPVVFNYNDYLTLEEEVKALRATVANLEIRCRIAESEKPKTGEWVRLEREENVYDLHGVPTWGIKYMCDKCGFITTAIQDHFGQYKFCPNCGSRMEVEE